MSVTDPTLLPSPQRGAFWRWPLGTALPLVLLTLGLVPPLIGSAQLGFAQPSGSMPFGQQLCDVALFAATAAFVVNLLLLNPITPVSTWRPLGHLVLALWPLALLVIAATAIAYAFGFVLVILLAMLHFAKFVAVLPDTSKTLLLYGAALCVGLLIARAFGAILFFEQRGAFALQGSLARRWRFAHHWGFFTYPVLALSADSGLGRDPLLVSLAVCGAAVPHIVLTAWRSQEATKSRLDFGGAWLRCPSRSGPWSRSRGCPITANGSWRSCGQGMPSVT